MGLVILDSVLVVIGSFLVFLTHPLTKLSTFNAVRRRRDRLAHVVGANDGFRFHTSDIFWIGLRQPAVFKFWDLFHQSLRLELINQTNLLLIRAIAHDDLIRLTELGLLENVRLDGRRQVGDTGGGIGTIADLEGFEGRAERNSFNPHTSPCICPCPVSLEHLEKLSTNAYKSQVAEKKLTVGRLY